VTQVGARRTWLVLGGGGALGAFQAGSVAALLEAGIVVDGFYGCSAGALNAAFLAVDPSEDRAASLERWWTDPQMQQVLAPSPWRLARGAVRLRFGALLDDRPLRRLIHQLVPAHDMSELSVPISVTTTCLECGVARHHRRGPVPDVLLASCALPGLFPPVRLPDGHAHVDGGIVCGVPLAPALDSAGPDDVVIVSDIGLAPVTNRVGGCGSPVADEVPGAACGLPVVRPLRGYEAPVERAPGALDVVLRAFTAARGVANRSAVAGLLDDPRVRVLPHVADAYAVGLMAQLPDGPRDLRRSRHLLDAGRASTALWLQAGGLQHPAGEAADRIADSAD
jgi:predicted acylesterase/phospholipase RssA